MVYDKVVLVFFSLLILALSGLVKSFSDLEDFFSPKSQRRCSHQYHSKESGKASSSLVHWVNCD